MWEIAHACLRRRAFQPSVSIYVYSVVIEFIASGEIMSTTGCVAWARCKVCVPFTTSDPMNDFSALGRHIWNPFAAGAAACRGPQSLHASMIWLGMYVRVVTGVCADAIDFRACAHGRLAAGTGAGLCQTCSCCLVLGFVRLDH